MKINKILFCIFLLSVSTFSQTTGKYIVYLKDKPGIKPAPETFLSAKAIERRKKLHGGRLFLTEDDYPVQQEYVNQLQSTGCHIGVKLRWLNAVTVCADAVQIARLSALPCVHAVAHVAAMQEMKSAVRTTIPLFTDIPNTSMHPVPGSEKQLEFTGIKKVQALGITGEGVIIGVLDSGFDLHHESLRNLQVIAEYDFVKHDTITAYQPGDAPSQDQHGTFVLSVLAGNKAGTFTGAAYGARVVLAKTEDIASETHAEEDNFAAALEWMDSIGVDIVTSSLGYNTFDKGEPSYSYRNLDGKTTIVTKAVNAAINKGITMFNSAGNEGNDSWHFILAPADAPEVIAVGAVDQQNTIAPFSSRGPTYDGRIKPELTSLGVNVYGAYSGTSNEYFTQNGTSAATPLAAGTGALTLSAFPFLTNGQLRNIILHGTQNFPVADNAIGFGLLSAYKTLMQPVIKNFDNQLSIVKIAPGAHCQHPQLFIANSNGAYAPVQALVTGSAWEFALLNVYRNTRAEFYFSYTDSSGLERREPAQGVYYTNDWQSVQLYTASAEGGIMTNWFPNPFRHKAYANIQLQEAGEVQVMIYQADGALVYSASRHIPNAGLFLFEWDGRNNAHVPVCSGVYICGVKTPGGTVWKKIIRLL